MLVAAVEPLAGAVLGPCYRHDGTGGAVAKLYGRDGAATLVRQLMTRPMPPGAQAPVLVFEGPPASGKTELLRSLAGLMEGRVPCARLDLQTVEAALGDDGVPELLAAVAFLLARRTGRYGALRFPRLVVGHLVMGLTLEWLDREQARDQVDAALSAHRGVDRWTRALGDVAAQVLARVPGLQPVPPSVVKRALSGAVHTVNRWGPGRRMLLGPYQEWYGRRDDGVAEPAIEALVGLNRWAAHHDNPDNRQRIASLLFNAFLADATDNFATGARRDEWSLNCVLLLDNADNELGRSFLTHLVQARRDHAAGGLGEADPITVVTTSRGDLLSEMDAAEIGDDIALVKSVGRGRQWWLRHELRPLSLDATNVVVSSLSLPSGNSQRLAVMVRELTAGQPAATQLLLDVVADRQSGLVEMNDLLTTPRQGRSVEEALYQRLLAGIPADVIDDLTTCAAARDQSAGRLLAQSGLIANRGLADTAAMTAGLWASDDHGDYGEQPSLIRRLLLRKLALRPDGEPASWDRTHQWLYQDAFDRSDVGRDSCYYAVALRRFDIVADALTERLDAPALSTWLASLHAVVWAPRPAALSPAGTSSPTDSVLTDFEPTGFEPTGSAPTGYDSPVAVAQRLAAPHIRRDPVYSTVLNLLVSLSVARDPLCGSLRSGLYWQIANRYGEIAHHIGTGSDELAALVQHYQVRARQWQQQPTPQQPIPDTRIVGQATGRSR